MTRINSACERPAGSAAVLKGQFSKNYLSNIHVKKDGRQQIQPTAQQLSAQLDKLRLKDIKATMHSASVTLKIPYTKGIFFGVDEVLVDYDKNIVEVPEYEPVHVLHHLAEIACIAQTNKKPEAHQYPLVAEKNPYGEYEGFCNKNQDLSHIESFVVTAKKAALQVGPFFRTNNLFNDVYLGKINTKSIDVFEVFNSNNIKNMVLSEQGSCYSSMSSKDLFNTISPPVRIYNSDFSPFVRPKQEGLSPQEFYLNTEIKTTFSEDELLSSPQSTLNQNSCGTLGNLWIKNLLENNTEMLDHTFLVDIPERPTGFYLPPPGCLRYSESSLYFKLAEAMMSNNPLETLEHKGILYNVTTITGLMNMGIPVRRASDGQCLTPPYIDKKSLSAEIHQWHTLAETAHEWRDARQIDGINHALKIKTLKQSTL